MSGPAELGNLERLPVEEPFPGVHRRSFSSRSATLARYRFDPGGRFPTHSHEQEQITLVEDGAVAMTIAGEAHELAAGGWAIVEAGIEHGITAGPEGATVLAVIVPRRAGSDAYELSEAAR